MSQERYACHGNALSSCSQAYQLEGAKGGNTLRLVYHMITVGGWHPASVAVQCSVVIMGQEHLTGRVDVISNGWRPRLVPEFGRIGNGPWRPR